MNICLMSYCQCEFTRNPHAEPRHSGASVGGGEVGVVSRRSGSGSDYDQWTLSVKSENHTPLPDETSTDETTPKPDEPRPRL